MGDHVSVGTRCCVPRLPDPLVRRPQLEERLADGVRCPVTLVSGPPGAGKTTLLASWVASAIRCRAAWLTVDGSDNQRGRLAALVVEALRRAGMLQEPTALSPASDDHLLDAAFEQILGDGTDCVLVLEDVQELRSRSALRTLSYLLERAPTSLDVVLSTRADPPISWRRLWLEGRVGEIRHADLDFDEAEAAELIRAHGVDLSPQDIRTLWSRTAGWAAGLRLAACALQSEADPHRFVVNAAATQAAVSDYLLSEVLMRQDKATQDFLFRTSVAERLTPDLAMALTGDERSDERLLALVRRGLFVVVETDDETGYRYHALFRALLQARLKQRAPDLFDGLHGQAAVWYLANGMLGEAEVHARTAGDWELAGQLILDRWLEATVGEGDPFADDPLRGVPSEIVLRTPQLAMVAATEACHWSKREEADLYRAALDEMGPPMGAGYRGDGQQRSTYETAQLLFDVSYGWAFGANDRSRAAVAALRELTATEVWTARIRQLALLAQAEQDIDAGDLDLARRDLADLAYQGDGGWHRTMGSAALAVVDASAGDVRAAEERLVDVLAEMDERPVHPTTHFADLASALCAAQRGGQRRVGDALSSASAPLEWSSRSLRYVDRALRAAVHGRAPFFVSLDAKTARHPLAERALVALGVLEVIDAQGRLIAIGAEGERVVAEARRLLGEDAVGQAADALTSWLDNGTSRHPRTVIEAGVLAAVATHQRGEHGVATRRLVDALDLSMATGIFAPLRVHGRPLRGLLEGSLDGLGSQVASALGLLDRLQYPSSQDPVEPLTDREIEVLQRLPTLMSNVEIAQGMHLSVNTVKTHLKAVYRKLGVDGRREAVLRGQDLELL
jgi:LuxR family maltose regulon positive regulatory protein